MFPCNTIKWRRISSAKSREFFSWVAFECRYEDHQVYACMGYNMDRHPRWIAYIASKSMNVYRPVRRLKQSERPPLVEKDHGREVCLHQGFQVHLVTSIHILNGNWFFQFPWEGVQDTHLYFARTTSYCRESLASPLHICPELAGWRE